jgi:hypothetical protein
MAGDGVAYQCLQMTSSYTRATDLQDAIDAFEDERRSAMTSTIGTISRRKMKHWNVK